jgi:NADH-ubiquinone oxidoreductase chain 4
LAVLGFALLFSFFLGNLLGFYIFFELSLLPLIFVIMGWGYQVERVSASFYLLIYTLVGSFPLLLVFLILRLNQSNLN